MNDVEQLFKAPASDLGVDVVSKERPHLAWRVFFWINVVLSLLVIFVVLFLPKLTLFDYIDSAVFGVSVLGLYLFSFGKEIKNNLIWKLFFGLYVLWFLFYEFAGPLTIDMTHYGEPSEIDAFIIVSLMFFLPSAYALYLIGIKSSTKKNKRGR